LISKELYYPIREKISIMEEEKIKKIVELKEILEERNKKLKAEMEGIHSLLSFINNLLLEQSFKRAEEIVKPVPPKSSSLKVHHALKKTILLKTGEGELLAELKVQNTNVHIIPAKDKKFNINTPPFNAFLIDRIFKKMVEKDKELVKQSKLISNNIFKFKIETDADILQEIFLQNFNHQREREIVSATRWTLEKMFEKTKT
jgi:hypothetical protein